MGLFLQTTKVTNNFPHCHAAQGCISEFLIFVPVCMSISMNKVLMLCRVQTAASLWICALKVLELYEFS